MAFVPPIDSKIVAVNGDDTVARVKLTHPDEAKVGGNRGERERCARITDL